MRTEPVIVSLQATLRSQAALAGGDAAVDDAVAQLVEALEPALQLAVMQLAEQAAIEVGAQLPDHSVDVVVQDGEPTLRVHERRTAPTAETVPPSEDFDARITLRLPPSLKEAVEQAAATQGASVNTWVVDAIGKGTRKASKRGASINEEFDL